MGRLPVSAAVLLDTHVLVWLLEGNPRLGAEARTRIQAATGADALYVAAITPWEIAMLVSKGRLRLGMDVGQWIKKALALPGIRLLPLSPDIAVRSVELPGDIHADPADRMLIATARSLGVPLVTADGLIQQYGTQGYLDVIGAEQ